MSETTFHPIGLYAYQQYITGGRALSAEALGMIRQGFADLSGNAPELTSAVISVVVVLQLARREEKHAVEEALTALIKELQPEFAALRTRSFSEKGGPSEAELFLGAANARVAPQLGAERPEGSVPLTTMAPIVLR
ncbi:MAG: hypothetical protein U1E65_14265 [Myxococcota bacterium]